MGTGRLKSGPAALMQQKMQENRPCDGCGMFTKCGEELLSCAAFNLWVRDGQVQAERVSRKPNRGLYCRIFPGDRRSKKEAA